MKTFEIGYDYIVKILNLYVILLFTHLYHTSFRYLSVLEAGCSFLLTKLRQQHMLNEKQVIFNAYFLMTKMQPKIISNDALINWGGCQMAQTWWLRKLFDLDRDGILHPLHYPLPAMHSLLVTSDVRSIFEYLSNPDKQCLRYRFKSRLKMHK